MIHSLFPFLDIENPEVQETLIKMLAEAKVSIQAESIEHVCFAIGKACISDNNRVRLATCLQSWIDHLLDDCATLNGWYITRHPTRFLNNRSPRATGFFREARLHWIDWMIASIQGKTIHSAGDIYPNHISFAEWIPIWKALTKGDSA